MIAEKTDGMRYILYIVRINNVLKAVFVDRAFRMYSIESIGLQSGGKCIFDGELVKETSGAWSFYIHDAVLVNGHNIATQNLTKRLSHISAYLKSHSRTILTEISIKKKNMWNFKNFDAFLNREASDHDTDGIILTPINKGVETGTQYSMFKWKTETQHTMDFMITEGSRRFDVFVYNRRELMKYKSLSTRTPKGRAFMKAIGRITDNDTQISGLIIECRYMLDGTIVPLKMRLDKTRPNSLRTIEKTIINIKENITLEEFGRESQFKIKTGECYEPYQSPISGASGIT